MKRKIVVSDLDGTIIKHNNGTDALRSILAQDKQCIQELDDNHDVFVLSTGRNYKSVQSLFINEGIELKHGYFIINKQKTPSSTTISKREMNALRL